MNLLDENIRADQGTQLRAWHIPFRFLTSDLGRAGTQDADVVPLLHRLRRPTFFTHDRDYFDFALRHDGYCLVWLDGYDGTGAAMIRRFLKHPNFSTQARRMGIVARVHHDGIHFWRRDRTALQRVAWMPRA